MSEVWHKPLEKLRDRFADEAEGRISARLKVVLSDTLKNSLCGQRYTFQAPIRHSPRIWMLGVYDESIDPIEQSRNNPKHDPTCGEWQALTMLAKQAGKVVKYVKQARPPTLRLDADDTERHIYTREDDIWYATLFHLAWMELPASPLRARTWLSPFAPPEYTDSEVIHEPVSGQEASRLPIGLRSCLIHDPFTSSVYAIDALLTGVVKAVGGEGPVPPTTFRYDGRSTELAPIEWKLASHLWGAPDRTSATDAIEQGVWGDESENDDRLKSAVKRASGKLQAIGLEIRRKAGFYTLKAI